MAIDITLPLTDRYEAIAARGATESGTTLVAWVRQRCREALDMEAGRQEQADKEELVDATGLRTAFRRAPADVQATVEAALAPYR